MNSVMSRAASFRAGSGCGSSGCACGPAAFERKGAPSADRTWTPDAASVRSRLAPPETERRGHSPQRRRVQPSRLHAPVLPVDHAGLRACHVRPCQVRVCREPLAHSGANYLGRDRANGYVRSPGLGSLDFRRNGTTIGGASLHCRTEKLPCACRKLVSNGLYGMADTVATAFCVRPVKES